MHGYGAWCLYSCTASMHFWSASALCLDFRLQRRRSRQYSGYLVVRPLFRGIRRGAINLRPGVGREVYTEDDVGRNLPVIQEVVDNVTVNIRSRFERL